MFNCDQIGEYACTAEGERDAKKVLREYPTMLRPLQPTVRDVVRVLEKQYELPRK